MLILATAGHVDHGKSALVAALTGTHPDRLIEEQVREMTIDLGFAFFNLPDGNEVGIIDVPGHIDFIDNMLAGMGRIDAVLLIIAADEGVMPQTKEHIGIIDLLDINQGIVVLTKVDLIEGEDWLDLIEQDIRKELRGKSLELAPIIRVSAKTNYGIPDLIENIAQLGKKPLRNGIPARLPIDRVFSLQGFGTIVTGTLLDGPLKVGDEIEVLPGGNKTRIRGIQTHNKKLDSVMPGSRTAVNLVNIEKESINRGDVLVKPNTYHETSRIDVGVRMLADENVVIKHNDTVKFFAGTAKRSARVRLINSNVLEDGDSGFLQLELDNPLCLQSGDHYILRRFSPSTTLGGGVILDPHPKGRYKLKDESKYQSLQLKQKGSVQDRLLSESGILSTLESLQKKVGESESAVKTELDSLLAKKEIIEIKDQSGTSSRYISSIAYETLSNDLIKRFQHLHAEFPARKSFTIGEINKSIRLEEPEIKLVLDKMVKSGDLEKEGNTFNQKGTIARLSPAQERKVSELWALIDSNPFSPPSYEECLQFLGKDLLKSLLDNGQLVQVSPDILFRQNEYDAMVKHIDTMLASGKPVTIMDLRDAFNSSRKYIVPFLEHMDRIKKTRREGDFRIKY
jgi:selenocysteine-specific elongation factor